MLIKTLDIYVSEKKKDIYINKRINRKIKKKIIVIMEI